MAILPYAERLANSATVIATYRHLRRSILLAFKGIRSINHTMARTRIRTDTSN